MKQIKKVLLVGGYTGAPKLFDSIKAELEAAGCEVAAPEFPTRGEISLESYFAVFDEYSDFISPDTAVIAYSMGNGMLLKYLLARGAELGRFVSLAGFAEPFEIDGKNTANEKLTLIDFSAEEREAIGGLIHETFSIFSNDDPTVPFGLLRDFPRMLGGEGILIENAGHFAEIAELPGVVNLATGNIHEERSCGCIVLDGDRVLVEQEISRNGDRFWGFPKGHTELGETDIEAALRETLEEVGLEVKIIDESPFRNIYFVHGGEVLKRVLLYLAEPVGDAIGDSVGDAPGSLSLQAEEVADARWADFDEARELMDFEQAKITIDEVRERLVR